MTRPDDQSIDEAAFAAIRREADRLLRQTSAYDRFPTPVADILESARLRVEPKVPIDEGFLQKLYRTGRETIRKAMDKVWGILDVRDRQIYIDETVHEKKQVFLTLHETGHHELPWQRDLFNFIEDSQGALDPEMKEDFERQANVFASEILFQLDRFTKLAADKPCCAKTPLELSKLFGSSAYAAFRRYVTTTGRPCALLVLEQPVLVVGKGRTAQLRRFIPSKPFLSRYGNVTWPDEFDNSGFLRPIFIPQRKLILATACTMRFAGKPEQFFFEAFNSGYGIFVLLYPESDQKRVVAA
jgi:hypothetical protein